MSKTGETRVKLPVDRLVKGLYVDLELGWKEHPFLFARFKIRSDSEVSAIRSLGLTEVTVIPERSSVEMPDLAVSAVLTSQEKVVEELWQDKKQHIDQAAKYRDRRNAVAQRYQQQAQKVKKVVTELKSQPANAIHNADEVVEDLVALFTGQQDMLTNLVNLGGGRHSTYNHAVNVTMLSLMLGKAEGLSPEELHQLGMGALMHDLGKIEIPGSITMKKEPLTRAEQQVLERHTVVGSKLVERVRNVSPAVIDIIEHHHEFLDGTGYPHQLNATKISRLVRIVTVANTYDNLCNPQDIADAVTPKTALAMMFTKYKDKLDRQLIERFIRTLGVYPPGTIVKLTDDSIGLVVTVDPAALLKPEVLLYNPDIPRKDALIVDLKQYEDLSIKDVVMPGDYPSRIYEYLGIEERLGYFIEQRPG